MNTLSAAVVGGVVVEEVMDASSIRLTWGEVVLQEWEVDHYTIYHTVFSTSTNITVFQESVKIPNIKTARAFYLVHLDPKFEHSFQVTVSIVVEGVEFESQKHTPLIFNFGKQLMEILIFIVMGVLLVTCRCKPLPAAFVTSG
jgi:hypothetical protein